MPATIIIMALVVSAAIGGSVSIAAHHSMPGEPLHVFKAQVNERVTEFVEKIFPRE